MARISTYEQVTPTIEDHVIGTDAENGNATRTFSIAALRDLIAFQGRQIATFRIDFGASPEIPFPIQWTATGPNIPAVYLPTLDNMGNSLDPEVDPTFTVQHDLNSTLPVVTVYVQEDPTDSTQPISYVSITPGEIEVIDANSVRFSLGEPARYVGYAIIQKGVEIQS